MKKIELLAPAGNLEKLKMAITYGADAVYFAGERFGLRARAGNLTLEEIEEGIGFAHERGAKGYLTVNIIPHNEHLKGLNIFLKRAAETGVDGMIISDPGVFHLVKAQLPDMDIHISTQANTVNSLSAGFWHDLGAKRIILARELSLGEIKGIRENTPADLELETFAHGAMCISYSGRCLLSNYMADRDSNLGDCAHPCRWKYYLMEEKRPGQFYPVYEDQEGTFIMNSKDLCMIKHIPQLIESGVSGLKIEGRMKSVYYVATVVKAYREAIDAWYHDPAYYQSHKDKWMEDVCTASHRDFTTGFYLGKADKDTQIYDRSSYIRDYDFVGLVIGYDKNNGVATIEQRNPMFVGDVVEIMGPDREIFAQVVEWMKDEEGNHRDSAPHPQQIITMPVKRPVKPRDILRKPITV